MFQQPLEETKQAISALRASLNFNEEMRNAVASKSLLLPKDFAPHPDPEDWKVLDHCTAVTRLYLVYESLVHECVSEWLSGMQHLLPYDALPERVRRTHREGLGHILQNLEGRRFSTLSVRSLVKEYQEALSAQKPYKLHADAFLLHDRNLKLDELHEALGNCGLDTNISQWLKSHRLLHKHDALGLLGHSSIDTAISALVDLRNEASHATRKLDQILGKDTLLGYVDLVTSLVEAIAEGFAYDALTLNSKYGAWIVAGKINYVGSDKKVCIAPISSCSLRVRDRVYIRSKTACYRAEVVELQINSSFMNSYTVAAKAEEVGIKFDVEVYKSSEIFIDATPPPSIIPVISAVLDDIETDDYTEPQNEQADNLSL